MEQDDLSLQQGAGENTPKLFNVKVGADANGDPIMQTVSEDELLNGYLRQQDYTKKTQELAQQRKTVADPTDDESEVDQYLENKGYAKKDTIEQIVEQKLKGITKAQQDNETIKSIIQSNPELKQFEGAIRKIAATDDSAIEDIVVKYGFSSHDKLSKAKQRNVIGGGDRLEDGKTKPVAEWNKEDWEKFEASTGRQQFR